MREWQSILADARALALAEGQQWDELDDLSSTVEELGQLDEDAQAERLALASELERLNRQLIFAERVGDAQAIKLIAERLGIVSEALACESS